MKTDRGFLEQTLDLAKIALAEGDYPIGSLVLNASGKIISLQRNRSNSNNDHSSHAEILSLREIGITSEPLTLYSSLEPCYGCSFFIARSSITKIVSALKDPHKGGIGDLQKQSQFEKFFADIEIVNEPFEELKEISKDLMRQYFVKIKKPEKAELYK